MSRYDNDRLSRWPQYVSVTQRRAQACQAAKKLGKNGKKLNPIQIVGAIATTFWGKAWCKNLESYADFSNRMPRGRSYARNGSIIDLQVKSGNITALVSGSSVYRISISIAKLPAKTWQAICGQCAAEIDTMLDLMSGKLPKSVLERLTDQEDGLFPKPRELKIQCSCPDGARMCKHVAATLYGVGHLLESQPELFFKLRGVDQAELVSEALHSGKIADNIGLNANSTLGDVDLGSIFGIDLTPASSPSVDATPQVTSKTVKAKAGKSTKIAKVATTKKSVSAEPKSAKSKSPRRSATQIATTKRK